MDVSIEPLSLEEFLAWERAQPLRYEFDGIQPIGMTDGSPLHAKLIARVIMTVANRIPAHRDVFASGLKVITDFRVRYPDVTVACSAQDEDSDEVRPTVIFEVTSPSTALTDRRVKPYEYRTVPSVFAYVVVSQDKPEITVLRRSTGWLEETFAGQEASVPLPEIGIELLLAELYR